MPRCREKQVDEEHFMPRSVNSSFDLFLLFRKKTNFVFQLTDEETLHSAKRKKSYASLDKSHWYPARLIHGFLVFPKGCFAHFCHHRTPPRCDEFCFPTELVPHVVWQHFWMLPPTQLSAKLFPSIEQDQWFTATITSKFLLELSAADPSVMCCFPYPLSILFQNKLRFLIYRGLEVLLSS